jgi:hypothetical protein
MQKYGVKRINDVAHQIRGIAFFSQEYVMLAIPCLERSRRRDNFIRRINKIGVMRDDIEREKIKSYDHHKKYADPGEDRDKDQVPQTGELHQVLWVMFR